MTRLELDLDVQEELLLQQMALNAGQDVTHFVNDLVKRELKVATRKRTWDNAVEPLQKAMSDHGMTEEESLAFFEAEREAMWRERRAILNPEEFVTVIQSIT